MGYGLNFQTNTIINSTNLFGKAKSNSTLEAEDMFQVKYGFNFKKDCVKSIRYKAGYNFTPCEATLNFANVTAPTTGTDYYRLDIYLAAEGAEPAAYANDMGKKVIPFWVEFTVKKGESNIAAKVADLLKKNNVFFMGEQLINTTVSGNVITLTGATEYQRFDKIQLYKYETEGIGMEEVANVATITKKGTNSFGTYSQLIKDLRLPTAANTNWTARFKEDTPTVGAIYNQYIIEYQAPANNNSMQAVGGQLDSVTVHSFWVNQAIDSAWKTAIAIIDPDGENVEEENITDLES